MWVLPSYKTNAEVSVFLVAFVLISAMCGCGSSELAKVRGSVHYRGKPLEHGRIGFHPQTGRPAFGDIHNGKFTLATYTPSDGAVAGAHRVTVHCDVPKDPGDAFSDRVSLIPGRYQKLETSGLTVEVKAGVANDFDFELTD